MIDLWGQEYLARGTTHFPMQYYQCDTADLSYHLPLHWHTDFEILRVTSGEYNMFIADSEQVLQAGDIAFMSSAVLHGDGAHVKPCRFESVVFDPEMLRNRMYSADKFISCLTGEGGIKEQIVIACVLHNNDSGVMQAANSFFGTMRRKDTGYELIATGLMLTILGIMQQAGMYHTKATVDKACIERIKMLKSTLDIIRENYARPLTLNALSESVRLSTRYFCKLFRKMTRCSPIDYLNKYRMWRACDLLRNGSAPVNEVAIACGVPDTGYFIRLFRRYKGLTPLKYRKLTCNS